MKISIREADLSSVLSARDERAALQQSLLKEFRQPLICFTMNIPGPIKDSTLIRRAYFCGRSELESMLQEQHFGVLCRRETLAFTGCEIQYAVDADADKLKEACIRIEETHPLGRLFDMDVIRPDGTKIDRSGAGRSERGCIVCGKPGRECASRRIHSVAQLQQAVRNIITDYFRETDIKNTADLVNKALLEELYTTPKPGLVDRNNNGSHKDMDISSFERSAGALYPFWKEFVRTGMETASMPPQKSFDMLRQTGIEAEKAMLKATGGVNTHKGAVFIFGLVCGAAGRLWSAEEALPMPEAICAECRRMAADAMKRDWEKVSETPEKELSYGQKLYLEYGIKGARGEAETGFSSVLEHSLPVFESALAEGKGREQAAVEALLSLIALGTDSNMIHRAGLEASEKAAAEASVLLAGNAPDLMEKTEALDRSFIAANMSPGGCADLLALTLFFNLTIMR